MNNEMFSIPIVLFVFRRLDTVKQIINSIRSVNPCTVYVFSDASRSGNAVEFEKVNEVREYIQKSIDWDCDKRFFFAEKNKGCDRNIREGLDKVFSEQSMAIILEDDAVPTSYFFEYCKGLLYKYESDKRIQFIAGFNAIGTSDIIESSYTFGKTVPMSGAIATWADRWNGCDFELRKWPENKRSNRFNKIFLFSEIKKRYINEFDDIYSGKVTAWDLIFEHDLFDKDRFAIAPKKNLATSYGFVEGAFHPQGKKEAIRLFKLMSKTEWKVVFPLTGPDEIVRDIAYDKMRQKKMLSVKGNFIVRRIEKGYLVIKNYIFCHVSEGTWNKLKSIFSN